MSAVSAFGLWAAGLWLGALPSDLTTACGVVLLLGGGALLGVLHAGVARRVAFTRATRQVELGSRVLALDELVAIEEIDAGSPRHPATLLVFLSTSNERIGAGPLAPEDAAAFVEAVASAHCASTAAAPRPTPAAWFFRRALVGAGLLALTSTVLFRHPLTSVASVGLSSMLAALVTGRDRRRFERSSFPRHDGVPRSLDRWLLAKVGERRSGSE